MRGIKFRAWNKFHKEMYDVYSIDFQSQIVYCTSKNGSTHTFGMIDIELMQYTGLTDKNGKLIFEGDTIVTDDDFERNDYPVVWDECGFWAIGGGYDAPLCDLRDNEHIEIIGNVHGLNSDG